ncbi:AMP-binding protein [Nocardia altamirensis]|uniref:AMP-binding protein n=1 Tax=Nocardia altamirensis TaxID=472158 RepID=UPI000A05A898|nr:AMP-binding protein [Nocardia altamirensis]
MTERRTLPVINGVPLSTSKMESLRRELASVLVAGQHALLAPAQPRAYAYAYLIARELGVPFILGAPHQQAKAFDTYRTIGDLTVVTCPTGAQVPPVLATTSGTSGLGRYVAWSPEALAYQATATTERLGTTETTRYATALGMGSSYGFSVFNLALEYGTEFRTCDATSVSDLLAMLIARRCDSLDTLPGVWRYLAQAMRSDADLADAVRALTVRGVGGEVVAHDLLDFFEDAGAPLHNGYGLTEAGPNVAISIGAHYSPRHVGIPLVGTEVRIVDDEIQVRSASVADQVWSAEQRQLIPNPDLTDGGWLRTKDIGTLDPSGLLAVHGRLDAMLISQGAKLHSSVLEQQVRGTDRTAPEVAVLQVDPSNNGRRRVVLVAITDAVDAGDDAELARSIVADARAFPVQFKARDILLMRHADVPLTAAGKVDRRRLSAQVAAHLNGSMEMPCTQLS